MHPENGSRSAVTLQYLAFNCSEGLVMENMNLRKTLSYAIDREATVAAILSPGTIPVDRVIDPSIIIDGKSVTEAYSNSTGVPPSGDIEKAKEFLNKALSELGFSKPSDLPSINYVCMDSPVHKQYAEALQAGWKDGLGVDVGISILPVPQAIGALLSGQFDIFLVGQTSGVDPATVMNNFTIGNGANNANIVIPDPSTRKRFRIQRDADHYGSIDPMVHAAVCAGYGPDGADWVREMREYMWENVSIMKDFFTRNIPAVTMTEVEGSFVIWIDWRRLKLDDEELHSFLLNEAYLDLDRGINYGEGGEGFTRMNIAAPRRKIEESLGFLFEAAARRGYAVSETLNRWR